MRRNMDLIRQIVLAIEDAVEPVTSSKLQIDGFTAKEIAYHCELITEAGLVDFIDTTHYGSEGSEFHIRRLTKTGHDLADACRSESIWRKLISDVSQKAGGLTLDVLLAYAKSEAMKRLGLDP